MLAEHSVAQVAHMTHARERFNDLSFMIVTVLSELQNLSRLQHLP